MKKEDVVVVNPSIFDPFCVFQWPQTFHIDLKDLDRRYGQLQQVCHPDRHPDAMSREIFEKKSMEITRAYQILKDPVQRALCLLSLQGLTEPYKDTQVLMEMMTLKEDLEEGQVTRETLHHMQRQALEHMAEAFAAHAWSDAAFHCYRYQFLSKLEVSSHVITAA
jgi:molecular chaperone HscB